PKSALAHNNLGAALANQGKREEAIPEYRKAIELDPKYALPHNGLGNALAYRGKLDEAVIEYRRAMPIDPKYANAHGNLADTLVLQGKLEGAIAEFDLALQLTTAEKAIPFRIRRAVALARVKDHAGASAEAEALANAKNADVVTIY